MLKIPLEYCSTTDRQNYLWSRVRGKWLNTHLHTSVHQHVCEGGRVGNTPCNPYRTTVSHIIGCRKSFITTPYMKLKHTLPNSRDKTERLRYSLISLSKLLRAIFHLHTLRMSQRVRILQNIDRSWVLYPWVCIKSDSVSRIWSH